MPKSEGFSQLKKHLSAHEVAPLYIFHGPETFLREHYLRMLKKELLPEGLDSFNLHQLEGKSLTLEALRDAVESAPLMCDKKLVLVYDFDMFKANAAMRTELEKYLSQPITTSCLVFIYDTVAYKPDGRTKLGDVVKKNACVVEFEWQDNAHLVTWLKRHFAALDKQIGTAEAEHLIFLCGGSMNALKNEVEKLAAYAKQPAVSKADIDRVVIPVLEAKAFAMTDAIANGQMRKAALLLRDLTLMREEPLMLLGAMGRQLRGLYVARLALEHRKDIKEVMDVMGYKSRYPASLLLTAAQKRSLTWCRKALRLCADTDVALKSHSHREGLLELLLAELW